MAVVLVSDIVVIDYENIKEESKKEYEEMCLIFGENSEEALSAKKAFVEASSNIPLKSRSELEEELKKAEEEKINAIDNYTLELINGGIL